jgi:hypothetical protein
MFIAAPLSGVVHTGAVAAWTTWPAAFLSYNFTGLVLPPLNTLIVVPDLWAVSLISCSNRSKR